MTYRVIQWATGNVGRAAIEGVLAHPDLELVGCWVHSAAKDGVDVAPSSASIPSGVGQPTWTRARLDADCVVYSPMLADTPSSARILESGKNLVTPVGWYFPPGDERAHSTRCAAGPASPCTARASTPVGSPNASH